MSKKECSHHNINHQENLSLTTNFYSTKIGWADIDDSLIDSSISNALESLQKIKFVRERNGSSYKWDIYYVMQDQLDHLGYLSYLRIDNENISLGYLYVLTGEIKPIRVKALMIKDRRQILKNAVTCAKLRVDKDHNVGVFYRKH
tara:strand:- start:118 stop:552 length:435 start_codon:yes stop_codon:yes gene_type:complete